MEIAEEVNASKDTVSGDEVWTLLEGAGKVVVASGKKVLEYEPASADREEFLKKVTGRTGNLRAPALRIGDNYYIGFNEEMYGMIGKL
jgi:hypothetical protein